MKTLIAKNFHKHLLKEFGNLNVYDTTDFWVLDPDVKIDSKKALTDEDVIYKLEGQEAEVRIVFYPFFDQAKGESHLIYSERDPVNKTISVYYEEDFGVSAADFFIKRLKASYLDRLKFIRKTFVLKDNQQDPNYASLINFMFQKIAENVVTVPTLLTTIRTDFQKYPTPFMFVSGGQILEEEQLLNHILGTSYLSNSIILSAYQTIPNHSNAVLLGTDGDTMFRENNRKESLQQLIQHKDKKQKGKYFILSNLNKNHWVLFVITTRPKLQFQIYDSLAKPNVSRYLDQQILVQQMNETFNPPESFTKDDITMGKMEQQTNNFDCGIFCLLKMMLHQ